MAYNYFDIIVSIIILLLGLKGIINGFFKELFGLIGIIGGIFLASRVGDKVGHYLSDLIFKFDSPAAISFTGFLATLAVFWLFMILIGIVFKKLSSASGLGGIDKILGFIFGSGKFFLIAAVIAYATYNIKAMRSTIDSATANSIVFPILVQTGNFIMKIDPVDISEDINKSIDDGTKAIENQIDTATKAIVKNTKEKLKDSLELNTDEEIK